MITGNEDKSIQAAGIREADVAATQFGRIIEGCFHEIYVCDAETFRFTTVNRGARENLGYSMEELRQLTLPNINPEFTLESYRELVEPLSRAQSERITFETVLRRKDGSRYPVEVRLSRVPDPPVIVANIIDVTERRLLLREVAHRSKNLLAIVIAIARQTIGQGPGGNKVVDQFAGRLHALGAAQDLLLRTDWRGVPMGDIVHKLLEHHGGRIAASGSDVLLKPEAAHYIGLAIHELAANAAQHGSLSHAEGVVTTDWGFEPRESMQFSINWVERKGPAVIPPEHYGFGRTVLEHLTPSALDGNATLTFAPEGFEWHLQFPAEHVSEIRTGGRNS